MKIGHIWTFILNAQFIFKFTEVIATEFYDFFISIRKYIDILYYWICLRWRKIYSCFYNNLLYAYMPDLFVLSHTYCTRIKFHGLIFHVFEWQENSWGIKFCGRGCVVGTIIVVFAKYASFYGLIFMGRGIPRNPWNFTHFENFYVYGICIYICTYRIKAIFYWPMSIISQGDMNYCELLAI